MLLDEKTLERMLATGKKDTGERPPTNLIEGTDEFEVYERAAPQGHREPTPTAAPTPAPTPPAPTPTAPPSPITASPHPAAIAEPMHHYPPATHEPRRPQVFATRPVRSLNHPTTTSPAPAAPAPPQPAQNHGGGMRIAIVQSDFNSSVTDAMVQSALQHAQAQGATIAYHVHVPGVYDVPLTTKMLAKRNDVDGVVVVGAVVQGETGHDELITREAARLLADIAYNFEKPIGLGIAGPRMTQWQAEARIHMGKNAMESVLRQLKVLKEITH